MKNQAKFIAVPLLLSLTACLSDNTDDTSNGESIKAITVSGSMLDLTGSWKTSCYSNAPDAMEETVFSGANVSYTYTKYDSTDGTCTGTATVSESYSASVVASTSASAITGWIDGQGSPATAPTAADVSGLLSDTASFTDLTFTLIEYVLTNGGTPPPAGTIFHYIGIVDDTGAAPILYRGDYNDGVNLTGAVGRLEDPFTKQ